MIRSMTSVREAHRLAGHRDRGRVAARRAAMVGQRPPTTRRSTRLMAAVPVLRPDRRPAALAARRPARRGRRRRSPPSASTSPSSAPSSAAGSCSRSSFLLAFAVGARLDRATGAARPAGALGIVFGWPSTRPPAPTSAMRCFVPVAIAVWGVGRIVRSRGRIVSELAGPHERAARRARRARPPGGRRRPRPAVGRARRPAPAPPRRARRLADGGAPPTRPTAAATLARDRAREPQHARGDARDGRRAARRRLRRRSRRSRR